MGSKEQRTQTSEHEATEPTVVQLGIQLLQNALDKLGLSPAHISASNITFVSTGWLRNLLRFVPKIESVGGFAEPNRIYVLATDGRQSFKPAVVCTLLHEEGHFVSMEFQPTTKQKIDNVTYTREGLRITAGGITFFRGFDEGSAEHFADFALRNGQEILQNPLYKELAIARVSPQDGHLSEDYQDYFNFWEHIQKHLAKATGSSEEEAEIQLLRSMASLDATALFTLESIYDEDALIMLGLYGAKLEAKALIFKSVEHSDDMKMRNSLIRDYFQSDQELLADPRYATFPRDAKQMRKMIADKVADIVYRVDPNILHIASNLPNIIRNDHQTALLEPQNTTRR